MTDHLQQLSFDWKKSKVSGNVKDRMDSALVRLSNLTGQEFHRITHLFGRMFTCEVGGLLFFSAGNGGRPSTIVVTALALDGSDDVFFPALVPEDMAACCKVLGIEDNDENRSRFESFVNPQRPSVDRRR